MRKAGEGDFMFGFSTRDLKIQGRGRLRVRDLT